MKPSVADLSSQDTRLSELQSNIRDLGDKLDAYKAKTAAAMGGSVFFLLLAAGGAYDLLTGKEGIWLALGITREEVYWITVVVGVLGALLLVTALARNLARDRHAESQLAELEHELAEFLEKSV